MSESYTNNEGNKSKSIFKTGLFIKKKCLFIYIKQINLINFKISINSLEITANNIYYFFLYCPCVCVARPFIYFFG